MTCAENRELHSALLDGEITAAERAAVESHLTGCAECTAELERLARMLGVIHALPATRASLGFVDRVLAATRPVPWYTRLGRRLLQPWQVKLPLEAAAVVIVALGTVYVFQKTPELQQATRYEAPAPQSAPAPETVSPPATPAPPIISAPPSESAPPPASAPAPSPASPPAPAPAAPAPALSARTAETPPARPAEQEAPKAQQAEGGKREALMKERDAARSRAATEPAEPARENKALERRELPATRSDAAKQDAPRQNAQPGPADQRLGAAAPASPARQQLVAPDASGRLVVTDRAAAETAIADLRGRLGVTEAFRRDAGAGAVSIELIVPRGAYAEFSRGLGEIGRWTVDREPSAAEPAPAGSQVRLQILLAP